MKENNILVINPGSTTTKIAVYKNQEELFQKKIDHAQDSEFQKKYKGPHNIFDQFEDRSQKIEEVLEANGINHLDAVVGRGGMLPSVKKSGTYSVNSKMLEDLETRALANHASNLGIPLAKKLAEAFNIPDKAFTVDPVTTDEILDKYKYTGIKEIKRYAGWHCLNQKAVSRRYAESINKNYEDLNLIVAHLGGGSSFGAHKKGRTVNVINALSGEGTPTPERSGSIPAQSLTELCFSGKYTKEEILHFIAGGGGLASLLGTKDVYGLRQQYEKGTLLQESLDILDFIITGFSQNVLSMKPCLELKENEKVDQIIITGGLAHWPLVTDKIKKETSLITQGVTVYPGEFELEALRDGTLRIINGEEKAKEY